MSEWFFRSHSSHFLTVPPNSQYYDHAVLAEVVEGQCEELSAAHLGGERAHLVEIAVSI